MLSPIRSQLAAGSIDASVSVIDVVETAENFAITDVAINMVVLQRELLKARNKELEKLVKSAKPKSLKIENPCSAIGRQRFY